MSFIPSRQVPIGTAAKPPLPFGKKVGPIKVGPNRPLGTGENRKYLAQCDCGHHQWYSAEELAEILKNRSGCGTENCTALSFRDMVWKTDESLRLQLYTILLLRPKEVESLWGGTFDDMYELTFDEAYENLLTFIEGEGVWLRRLDDSLPFLEGNIELGDKPDRVFNNLHRARVEVDGTSMMLSELSEIAGIGAQDLLLKLYRIGTTEDLLIKLMEDDNERI